MSKSSILKRGEILTALTILAGVVMLAGAFTATRLNPTSNQSSRTSAQSSMGCIETDGGKNPNIGGAVIATFPDPLNGGQQRQETYKDTCQPSFGSVPILTEYYCDGDVRKQEDLPCTYQAGAGRCSTDASGFGRCESGLPTVQVVSPGVPTPTAAYTYPPSAQHYIQSVEIVNVTRTQGTFIINGCTGTQNSGQSNAKFWVDGVMVRQPPEYADFVFNRGFPNDCETKTVTVYFNNLSDAQLCSGFSGLVANFFYFKNNGTKSNPFNVPPQTQYCPATATPVPPTAVPPTTIPVIPSATPDPRCGQPGNPACPTNVPPPTNTPVPTNTPIPPTLTSTPTATPRPTNTPIPPTLTSVPTSTPTLTPSRTPTPVPPTNTPTPTRIPTAAFCPYNSQAYIEGPSGTPFSQITFSSSSGGGTIYFTGTPIDIGGGRQRVTLAAGSYRVSTTTVQAIITINRNSIPEGYRIAYANCVNNNGIASCANWSDDRVIINLVCNANNLYGWHLDRIPCGQPGAVCPSNTPTAIPRPSATPAPQGTTYQLDILDKDNGYNYMCHSAWVDRCSGLNISNNSASAGGCGGGRGNITYTNQGNTPKTVACVMYRCDSCVSTNGENRNGPAQCQRNRSILYDNAVVQPGQTFRCTPNGAGMQSADINNDGAITVTDYLLWTRSKVDINNDGINNVIDLTILMQNLGQVF